MNELDRAVAYILQERERWEAVTDPTYKDRLAGEVFMSAVRLVRDLCGNDILRQVYKCSEVNTDKERLRLLSYRAHLASWLFSPFDHEPASLSDVAREAEAVAAGDAPQVFRRLPGQLKAYRVLVRKFSAIRWNAYLEGFEVSLAERQAAIARAYGHPWDTIIRWKEDAVSQWGKEKIEFELRIERTDAQRGLRRSSMRPGEHWDEALIRAGNLYKSESKKHAERNRNN